MKRNEEMETEWNENRHVGVKKSTLVEPRYMV